MKEDDKVGIVVLVLAIVFWVAIGTIRAEEPKIPEPEVEKSDPPANLDKQPEIDYSKTLTQDEIIYVKAQFREAVLISAANSVVIQQWDHWGNISTVHPEKNPVVQLICHKSIFKHYKDMENQIYDEVYNGKTATAPANPIAEAKYVKALIEDRVQKDPKFFDELVKAVKESSKHTYKEWLEISKTDK